MQIRHNVGEKLVTVMLYHRGELRNDLFLNVVWRDHSNFMSLNILELILLKPDVLKELGKSQTESEGISYPALSFELSISSI